MSLKNSVSQKILTVTVAPCSLNGLHLSDRSISAQILLLRILLSLQVIIVLDYARIMECARAASVNAQKDTQVNIVLLQKNQIQV